jgi:type I restriction-modification system DNA methylase subunit
MNIQETLQQPYDRASWTSLLAYIFPNVSIYQNPQKLENNNANLASDFLQLGSVRLADGKNLAIFEISINDKIALSRNRVGLRDLIASKIDPGRTHGVLCVFNSSEVNFRFTFVCKETSIDDTGQITTLETNSRKFTYILGPGETRRTAAQRFHELSSNRESAGIKEIIDAFSVERLNEEFFQQYKRHYQLFVDHLMTGTNASSKVFGVNVSVGSEAYEAACKPIRDWVKKLLGRIVFIHFIQKKGWMGCKSSSKGWQDGDPQFLRNLYESTNYKNHFYSKCLAPLFFDALNTPDRLGDIFALTGTKVPYLNGGLFEEVDDRTREIDFPASLFQNLLDFFASYNFTIDENDPEEHEVGIDPEMLGHIFENLLEENKDKGAYYTPKPVVQFMCQQSLSLYLRTHLGEQDGLDKLIRDKDSGENSKENWIRQNASKIEELLDNLTICDPAIGSGAFPIGMLQEIFWIKLALDWTLNEPSKFAQIKRRIIEHTIHGIDIDAGAVEIARLRCWLSLVVDEVNPSPLPNLEFKIYCANSLIEYMRGEAVNFLKHEKLNPDARKYIKELEISKTKLFEASRKPQKRAARLAIYRSMIELGKLEFTWMKNDEGLFGAGARGAELNKVLKDFNFFSSLIASSEKLTANEQDEILNKVEHWLGEKDKPTFAWRIHFAEVFAKGGFDLIIANPPYVSQILITEIKPILQEVYSVYTGRSDLYVYFYELAESILNNKGVICFITSNKFLRVNYGVKVKQFLAENFLIDLILDFKDAPVFQATTYPLLLIGSKSVVNDGYINYCEWPKDRVIKNLFNFTEPMQRKINISQMISGGLRGKEDNIGLLNENIKKSTVTLNEFVNGEIFAGIKTGLNDAFFLNKNEANELIKLDPKAANIIKPLLRGRDLNPWSTNEVDQYIIYNYHGIVLSANSSILKHLSKYRERLENRALDQNWYELQQPQKNYAKIFTGTKIIYPNVSLGANFSLNSGCYLDMTTFCINSESLSLLGILNSKLVQHYLKGVCVERRGGYLELKSQYMRELPIPKISIELDGKISALVSLLINARSQNSRDSLENQLNDLIRMAYGVSEEEYRLIVH